MKSVQVFLVGNQSVTTPLLIPGFKDHLPQGNRMYLHLDLSTLRIFQSCLCC